MKLSFNNSTCEWEKMFEVSIVMANRDLLRYSVQFLRLGRHGTFNVANQTSCESLNLKLNTLIKKMKTW